MKVRQEPSTFTPLQITLTTPQEVRALLLALNEIGTYATCRDMEKQYGERHMQLQDLYHSMFLTLNSHTLQNYNIGFTLTAQDEWFWCNGEETKCV